MKPYAMPSKCIRHKTNSYGRTQRQHPLSDMGLFIQSRSGECVTSEFRKKKRDETTPATNLHELPCSLQIQSLKFPCNVYKPVHLVPKTCVKELLVVTDGLYPHCEAKNSESRLEIKTKLSSTVISVSMKLLSVVITITYIYTRVTERKWEICEIAPHYKITFTLFRKQNGKGG